MLNFQPKPGSVVYCDYEGFIEPEMVKKRPVIVISKHRHNKRINKCCSNKCNKARSNA